ncbi:MAG: hypothetical protein ACREX9_16070 [Gammaproteobacteria bacterium]
MGIEPLGVLERAPSLVEKRVWQLPATYNRETDEVQLAFEAAVAATK